MIANRARSSTQRLRWIVPASLFSLTVQVLLFAPTTAFAQAAPPVPGITDSNSQQSSFNSQFDIGSNFLQRLSREATYGFAQRDNSGGGGASQSSAEPLYRSWGELYGIAARTGPQGDFVGDRRRTFGAVAGIGLTLTPGLNVGVSVDQSRTKIDVPLAAQSATLDLTQVGINAAYTHGAWTLAGAAVHGFAQVDSRRSTPAGFALAGYDGRIDGALAELNYYYGIGAGRIVPKLAVEYVSAHTDSFQEAGGFNPVTVAGGKGERSRVLAGAEIGHYWIFGQRILDISGYGKFIDNFSQNISAVQVSLGGNSIAVQGIRESRNGADTGAAVSWIITRTARIYANYDGKFRDGFNSQQGTLGLELKW